MTKSPSLLVTVEKVRLVSMLFASTLAPTIAAAFESVTRPVSVAVERVRAKLEMQRLARVRVAQRALPIHEGTLLPCRFIVYCLPLQRYEPLKLRCGVRMGVRRIGARPPMFVSAADA